MQQAQHTLSATNNQNRFLAIEVSDHGFGIPVECVREIIYHNTINPLPQTPDFVRGVTLIREQTIPVLDLNMLLGGEKQTPIHHESCFITIQLSDATGKVTQVCLLADRILQTYKIDQQAVDTPPIIGNEAVVSYVMGVARVADRNFVLLDPARLISPYVETVSDYITYDDTTAVDETSQHDAPAAARHTEKTEQNNKFLSVVVDDNEYAFPLSTVSHITDKSGLTDFVDNDVPDMLYGAAIFNNKPLAIVRLNDFLSHQGDINEQNISPVQPEISDNLREVVVVVEFHLGLLGIVVDRIGRTYDSHAKLKQNAFCTDLDRNRIKSLGFIDSDSGSIEAIEPSGILTSAEQQVIDSWMKCVERMIDMSESKAKSSNKKEKEQQANPLAQFAGSYLVVQVGKDLIGLNSADVDEVLSYADLIPLKGGPSWFTGLLDLRQSTYPVIDLHTKLDIEPLPSSTDDRNVLVMIKHNQQKLGLLVDKIIHSTHITSEQVCSTEHSTLFVNPEALHAVAEVDQSLIHIINLHQVIDADEVSARRLLDELNEQSEQQDVKASSIQ